MTGKGIKLIVRGVVAGGFLVAGVAHLVWTVKFARIVPPMFPRPLLLVRISGVCEMAGGIGLLVPGVRRAAAWGLIALLVAVFPANVYMAVEAGRFADLGIPAWGLWGRLPLQGVFIGVVYWVRGGGSNLAKIGPRPGEPGRKPGPLGRR